MKKQIFIVTLILSALFIGSCVKDLDVTPKDPNTILSGNLYDKPEYLQEALSKVYASFVISGQGANGGDDIAASDGNFFTTSRALWNLQEITTDEAICAWGDVGIADLNTQTWSTSNPFLTALYQRLGLTITYANEFIRNTASSTDPDIQRYNAEARFLRALAYFYYMDMFGNPPFTTEADQVGIFFPKQIDQDITVARPKLFNYIVSELLTIEPLLSDAGERYPQANKAADWMLLSRLYLNAEVYTGTAKWDSVKIYTDKVINCGKYSLNPNYRQNFCADNDYDNNKEMIYAWALDGVNTQGYVGTTFIIESSSDATYLNANDIHGLTSNTNWNGNRARKEFLNVMIDTLVTYNNAPVPYDTDPWFDQSQDSRVYLRVKKSPDIPSASSSGDYGIGVYKFTALNADGSKNVNHNEAFACTDFPIFRLAEAYMMRAEAAFRSDDNSAAAADINVIRQRAFGNTSHNITAGEVTAQFILDELGREFYYEAHRRTDLVRFGQFTNGTYKWTWKGGVKEGISTSSHMNIFPIPGAEISANTNIKQNPDY